MASYPLTGVKGEYANTVALTYDAGGRQATEALTIAGQTYSVGTAYDAAGRESQLTQPDGVLVGRTLEEVPEPEASDCGGHALAALEKGVGDVRWLDCHAQGLFATPLEDLGSFEE